MLKVCGGNQERIEVATECGAKWDTSGFRLLWVNSGSTVGRSHTGFLTLLGLSLLICKVGIIVPPCIVGKIN